MSKFTEGQKVRVLDDVACDHPGQIGTVVTVDDDGECEVQFIPFAAEYFTPDELELAPTPKPRPKLGDALAAHAAKSAPAPASSAEPVADAGDKVARIVAMSIEELRAEYWEAKADNARLQLWVEGQKAENARLETALAAANRVIRTILDNAGEALQPIARGMENSPHNRSHSETLHEVYMIAVNGELQVSRASATQQATAARADGSGSESEVGE